MKNLKTPAIIIASSLFLGACAGNTDTTLETPTPQQVMEAKKDLGVVPAEQILEPQEVVVNKARVENVDLETFKSELSQNDGIVIDLRTTKELEETGIIAGAKQMDFYGSDFKQKLSVLDKDKKYLIYCRSGGRSGQTLKIMKNLGFTNVIELRGGMNGWLSAGEKTEKFGTQKSEAMMDDSMMKGNEGEMMDNGNMMAQTIEIKAKNWEFDKPIIKVKQGEKITLKINNTDGLHGIAIPAMKVVENNELILDTSKKGEFEYVCANYCGDGHRDMKGKIIIE